MSTPSAPLPPLPPFPSTFLIPGIAKVAGPLFIGALLNWGLYGVLVVQTYIYFIAFPNDPKIMRRTVFGVFILETIQSILVLYDAARIGVRIDSLLALDEVGTLWLSIPLLTGLVTLICHLVYAYRIYILSMERTFLKRLAFFICGICAIQFGSSISLGVVTKLLGRLSLAQSSRAFHLTIRVWFSSSSAGDILIAVCMIYLTTNKDIKVEKTRRHLQTLVRVTIGTGALTATFAIVTFALLLLPGNPAYYEASAASLAKMYSISLVVLLNSRMKIQLVRDHQDTLYRSSRAQEELSKMQFDSPQRRTRNTATQDSVEMSVLSTLE